MAFIFITNFCFGADPVEGYWLSIDDKSGKATGGWEIYVQGDKLFGKVLSIADMPQDKKAVKCKRVIKIFQCPGKLMKCTL